MRRSRRKSTRKAKASKQMQRQSHGGDFGSSDFRYEPDALPVMNRSVRGRLKEAWTKLKGRLSRLLTTNDTEDYLRFMEKHKRDKRAARVKARAGKTRFNEIVTDDDGDASELAGTKEPRDAYKNGRPKSTRVEDMQATLKRKLVDAENKRIFDLSKKKYRDIDDKDDGKFYYHKKNPLAAGGRRKTRRNGRRSQRSYSRFH